MECRLLPLVLALALTLVHVIASDTAATSSKCSLEAQQFAVVVATTAPLGLRLSERLEVLEFVADSEGRGRAVEASGLAEIGDRLVAVNEVSLEGLTLQKAVGELQMAELPRTLRFQTHDGRCIQRPAAAIKESVIEAETASAVIYDPTNEENFDYVVSSIGEKSEEIKLYAVLSSDGAPPSCAFRELALARPFDACAPLSINVTDKYVLVPTVFGCPMHQKAAIADEAGAKDSGARLLEQMASVRPRESQQLRFVFSAACAADRFAVHPEDIDPLPFFEARRPAGIIMGDQRFPHAASSLAAAVAVQQISVPVVFISINAFRTIRRKLKELELNADDEDSNTHIHVEFSGENALEHQWKELGSLAVESNWPTTEAARDRLFHRMLKDQATLDDHDLQLSLVKNERYEALVASYWNAQRYYSARADDGSINEEGEQEDDR
uniref:PDZ domain-containing protein n=1 Tax=Phytophthora ramorum TaxID=164328 RepID=H3GS80_PHYRM